DRLHLKMDTPNLQLSYNIRATNKLQIKTRYRFYGLNNNAEPFTITGFVALDAEFERRITPGGVFTNLPIAYHQNTFSADAIYDVWKQSQISFGYTNDRTSRDFREVSQLNDNQFRVSFDSRPKEWIDFRASYERSDRNGNGYDFNQFDRN